MPARNPDLAQSGLEHRRFTLRYSSDNRHALDYMARELDADTRASSRLELGKLAGRKKRSSKRRPKAARKSK